MSKAKCYYTQGENTQLYITDAKTCFFCFYVCGDVLFENVSGVLNASYNPSLNNSHRLLAVMMDMNLN